MSDVFLRAAGAAEVRGGLLFDAVRCRKLAIARAVPGAS